MKLLNIFKKTQQKTNVEITKIDKKQLEKVIGGQSIVNTTKSNTKDYIVDVDQSIVNTTKSNTKD
jgi:hypothetical protein